MECAPSVVVGSYPEGCGSPSNPDFVQFGQAPPPGRLVAARWK